MIETRIDLMQSTIEMASDITSETKAEPLQPVVTLKPEIKILSEFQPKAAQRILPFANAASHEVSHSLRNPRLISAVSADL